MKNQFDEESIEEEFPNIVDETQASSKEGMFAQGPQGTTYDYMSAPDYVKAPPFIDLNGETVTLLRAELIIPPKESKWTESKKDSKIRYKTCKLTLYFDKDKQQSNISGVTVFDRNGVYSHPTINHAGETQAMDLLTKIAEYKNVSVKEISIRDMMIFLNSKVKCKIIKREYKNPDTNQKVPKNMVDKFIN